MKKYHAFYVRTVGYEVAYKCFEIESELLEFVKHANEEYSFIGDLRVVYGELLEFEPYEKVLAYRIKEEEDQ